MLLALGSGIAICLQQAELHHWLYQVKVYVGNTFFGEVLVGEMNRIFLITSH